MKIINKTLIAVLVASAGVSAGANASNVDVNNFLNKLDTAAANPTHDDLRIQAVNAFDNMNARDRMVVAGIADKTSHKSMILDVIGAADLRGHQAEVPAGWDADKTRAFIAAAHQPSTDALTASNNAQRAAYLASHPNAKGSLISPAPVAAQSRSMAAALPAAPAATTYDPVAHANANANAALKGLVTAGSAIQTAQATADQAQHDANWNGVKIDDAHHAIMVAQTDIDQNAADIADNNKHDAAQDTAIHHAQTNADAALHGNLLQSQAIKDNADAIAANNTHDSSQDAAIHHAQANADAALHGNMLQSQQIKTNLDDIDTLKGAALADANRDRTSSQHVAAPTPTNGKDGVTKVETDTATQEAVKGLQLVQANQSRTASQHFTAQPMVATAPKDGKDGVTTMITKTVTDTKTKAELRHVEEVQQVQGAYVQAQSQVIAHSSARIDQNSQQIGKNTAQISQNKRDIEDTRDELKRGLNNAAAMTGLHYHSNDSYAVSAGTANGDGAAIAGGLSHSITEHTAATVQASTSMDSGWMASVGFSGDF